MNIVKINVNYWNLILVKIKLLIQIVHNLIIHKLVKHILGVNLIMIHKHVIKYYMNHVLLYIHKLNVKIMDVYGKMIQVVIIIMEIVVNMKIKKNVNKIFKIIDNVYGILISNKKIIQNHNVFNQKIVVHIHMEIIH